MPLHSHACTCSFRWGALRDFRISGALRFSGDSEITPSCSFIALNSYTGKPSKPPNSPTNLAARRLAPPSWLVAGAPALYFRGLCFRLLAECSRRQFPTNHHRIITRRQTICADTATGLHSRLIASETSPVAVLRPPAYYGYQGFLITGLL